jgi:hypothetical protein
MSSGDGANVRIREINGKGVAMVFPEDVVVPSGVTRMGLYAWSGIGPSWTHIAVCVVFEALPQQRYLVTVGGYKRDWEVAVKTQREEKVAPRNVTYRPFDPNVLPCEGLK